MKLTRIGSSVTLCGAGFALAWLVLPRESGAGAEKPRHVQTTVVSFEKAPAHAADWGEIRFHHRGETLGTRDVLVAIAVLEPGKSIHRAHRHVEEEYQVVVEGSGMWHHDGKEFPARKGDVQYVAPWVWHGLTNTGDKPLTFVVFKYSGKGVELPRRPDAGKDEL